MQCALYDAGRCRSCQWIMQSVNEQLSAKTADLHRLLA
ncbi:23S rRNA (uracil(747)-C(5))-methyltransferase, partial [Salmonella enterica subsp. enterica serovar Java]|nr:23S rRNA (uracil(747)-C(5))-methyltransferase [Salmonella enterica subsp. enterica serovar Java]